MQGSLNDFDLNIRDLKVFKDHGANLQELFSEENTYNDRILDLKEKLVLLPFG